MSFQTHSKFKIQKIVMAFKEMTQERLRESAVRCQEQDYEDPAQMAGL